MATIAPRFEKVLVHSTHMPELTEFLRQHGMGLQPVNDVRDGPAHVLTIQPGARPACGRRIGNNGPR